MLVSFGCETLVLVAHALLHDSKLIATIPALSQKCFDYFFLVLGKFAAPCIWGAINCRQLLKFQADCKANALVFASYLLSGSASGEASAGAPSDAEALRLAFSAFFFFFSSSR